MPDIWLTWRRFLPRCEQSGTDGRIYEVIWRRNDNPMPMSPGLYVIHDGYGPVYAGKATNRRLRFRGRSDVLRNFRLSTSTTNPVATRVVDIAGVLPENALDISERWLVRFLHLEDLRADRFILQNIDITRPLRVPADGLTITNQQRPDYLDFTYTYAGGTTF
jgi:hypothetical protein